MPHVDQIIPSKFLKVGDLEGGELELTIAEVRQEELAGDDGAKKTKWVIGFREVERALVLNTTNTKKIAELHGPLTENWIGKRVRFYSTLVNFRGAEVLAIRVRDAAPQDEELPF